MIAQPKAGDGEAAWRRYCAALRQALGEANDRAAAETVQRVRADEAEAQIVSARAVRDSMASRFRALCEGIAADLDEGDYPAARERVQRHIDADERRRARRTSS